MCLNPTLYEHLQKHFRDVRVSNQFFPLKKDYLPDWFRHGRLKVKIIDYGETYRVNCPFCSDTRHRLYVNHCWGEIDEETRDDMLHLVKCFNEDCLNNRQAQKELHALVYPHGEYGRMMKVELKEKNSAPPPDAGRATFTLPDGQPFSKLSASHAAIRYLRKRDFNPSKLEKRWGVYFSECVWGGSEPRVVAPIYMPRKQFSDESKRRVRLAGWQARKIDDNSKSPKYLSAIGMKAADILYGLSQAKRTSGPIVVVEGITDVWRMGPGAVGLLGKSMPKNKAQLFRRAFPRRSVVVLLDDDASEAAFKVREEIVLARRLVADTAPVVLGKLPPGFSDPGECERDQLWSVVKDVLMKRKRWCQ